MVYDGEWWLLKGFPARHGGTWARWMVFVWENPNLEMDEN